MTTISILELSPRHPLMPAPADWYPIYLNQKLFRDLGLDFTFHSRISPQLYTSDILFISSRFFPLHTLTSSDRQTTLSIIANFKSQFE